MSSASAAINAEYAVHMIDEMRCWEVERFNCIIEKANILLDAGGKHWEKTTQLEAKVDELTLKVDELTLKVDRLLALLESKNKSICR